MPVELPDLQGREAILRVHAKDVMMADDIDYKAVARATSGASGAELANLINEAALRAVKGNRRIVNRVFGIHCTGEGGTWMPGILSRKKQVAAKILGA